MKTFLIIVALLVLAGGGYYWFMSSQNETIIPNEEQSVSNGKINIDEVCEGALAYMSFPDGESAERFVAECKAGEHPEVIERYKAEMNLGAGAEI